MKAKTYVPSYGNREGKFIIVGEQPGRIEVRVKRPFVGPAGKVLDQCLTQAGILRRDCFLTNVIKDLDRPLDTYVTKPQRKDPVWSEVGNAYRELLLKEIDELPNATIIAVGNVALNALTGRWGITKWAGSVLSYRDKKIIPIIHPATVIPPKNQYINQRLIIFDLKRALEVSSGIFEPTKFDLIIKPSFIATKSFLNACLFQESVAYDIEVTGKPNEKNLDRQVSCISFAYNGSAISIPFVEPMDGQVVDYFTADQELEIWQLIKDLLENPNIMKVGQNLVFDSHFLLRRYGIVTKNMADTMIAQQILMGEFPKGLDFITRLWTNHPYYKDDGKEFMAGSGKWEQFWIYNATDSAICDSAFPHQYAEITSKERDNTEIFNQQCQAICPFSYMMEHGIKVDVKGLKKAAKEMKLEAEQLKEELLQMALDKAPGLNLDKKMASSPKQLKEYFKHIGAPSYKTAAGTLGFDDLVLKRLSRPTSQKPAYREAVLIRKIRKNIKLSSTYTNLDKIDPDERIRCSYNPVGTRFSRASSSTSIFGTGMNLQNWPHKMMQYLIPDEGYIYFSYDLAQAENRIVAYLANDHKMIAAFEGGKDVHSLTGALISGKSPDEVKKEDDDDIKCKLGGYDKTWRFWGKKANHGLNYDLGFRKFALYYEIPERDAKLIVDRYHSAYPGVRQMFHAMVRQRLRTNRVLENLMGRKTMFYGKLDDKTFKDAYSCIPQGSVGDIINRWGLNHIYYDEAGIYGPVELMIQIHDSIGFQIHLSIGWERIADILLSIKKNLEQTLISPFGREFYIPADLTIGTSLYKRNGTELKGRSFPSRDKLPQTLKEKWEALNGQRAME